MGLNGTYSFKVEQGLYSPVADSVFGITEGSSDMGPEALAANILNSFGYEMT